MYNTLNTITDTVLQEYGKALAMLAVGEPETHEQDDNCEDGRKDSANLRKM